jgi:hypothetical protein
MELFAKATEFCGSEPTAKSQKHARLEFGENAFRPGGSAFGIPPTDRSPLQVPSRSRPVRFPTWRWACNKYLRHAIHLFCEQSIARCAWAEIYYKAHRAKDHSHARSLRCLGQRWLKIIHKLWLERKTYDAELHHRNQVKHGSWVFRFQET